MNILNKRKNPIFGFSIQRPCQGRKVVLSATSTGLQNVEGSLNFTHSPAMRRPIKVVFHRRKTAVLITFSFFWSGLRVQKRLRPKTRGFMNQVLFFLTHIHFYLSKSLDPFIHLQHCPASLSIGLLTFLLNSASGIAVESFPPYVTDLRRCGGLLLFM